MKNAGPSADGSGKLPPRDIVERTFDFAVRMAQPGRPCATATGGQFLILHF